MSPQQEAVALWKYLESRGFEPSMNSVSETLRRHGVRFTDRELRVWLDSFAPRRRRKPAANPPQKTSTNAANPPQPRRSSAAAYAREKEVSLVSTSSPDSLRSSGSPTPKPRRSPSTPKPDPDTSWIEPLIAAARPFKSVPLADLEADDGRAILGRYHALKFGNCCRNEHTNKLKGIQIAKGLATMSQHKLYGQLTVGQYVTCALKVHKQRNGEPWFDPWMILAFVDFEKGAA